MLSCFATETREKVCPITIIVEGKFDDWLHGQPQYTQTFLKEMDFHATAETFCILTNAEGVREQVFFGVKVEYDLRSLARLPLALPPGYYRLNEDFKPLVIQHALIYWGMGAYQFTRYKKANRLPSVLILPRTSDAALIENIVESVCFARDFINTPAEDMTPMDLAEAMVELASEYHASVNQIADEELLEENFPAIFTVGRASESIPRLIDFYWGEEHLPKITLVGKGVCFDTGGLDLKQAAGMILMKKDMGGSAHAIALARMIMQENLPVCLRVLIPAVENSVSGDAYRPGDVITMRNGKTVEIFNTDAEGRLVLADALTEASSESPELLIDFGTLTGAARVALGPEIANMFTDDDELAKSLMQFSNAEYDHLWRMPLFASYRKYLDSLVADLRNCSDQPFAGSVTAALFLKEFVKPGVTWAHFDMSGWSFDNRPGHPIGGDVLAIRAIFMYLRDRYSSRH